MPCSSFIPRTYRATVHCEKVEFSSFSTLFTFEEIELLFSPTVCSQNLRMKRRARPKPKLPFEIIFEHLEDFGQPRVFGECALDIRNAKSGLLPSPDGETRSGHYPREDHENSRPQEVVQSWVSRPGLDGGIARPSRPFRVGPFIHGQ